MQVGKNTIGVGNHGVVVSGMRLLLDASGWEGLRGPPPRINALKVGQRSPDVQSKFLIVARSFSRAEENRGIS
jgi:hypothetical protein